MARSSRHGLNKTPTHRSWEHMIRRCTKPNEKDFHRYGGRGIKVCNEWMLFDNFFRDMGLCPEGMTLDRVDNNADYGPGNCRWATRSVQSSNQRKRLGATSQFKGVCFKEGKWRAQIRVPGVGNFHIGTFTSEIEAADAYKAELARRESEK